MDSISHLLKGRMPEEPPEIQALKSYVLTNYQAAATVSLTSTSYVLKVPSAGLAANLQLEKNRIIEACNLDKPLRIHIGK